ncbi:MAG TPA: hypothetical protein VFX96_03340 [Pyrinomonadaceae bacterium]|nr:hypothetical protein [Pyrinomonadaceae bacterium]
MAWQNAPTLNKLTASQQGGSRGAQLWGSQYNGMLNTIFQLTPGGGWSDWRAGSNWNGHDGGPSQTYELAAAQQNDGRVQFWALDMKLQLWSTWQTSPGGGWSAWSGPNWNSAPQWMKRIAASQQGGSRGAQLWGITDEFALVTCFQITAGGNWSGWEPWPATPENSQFIEVTASQQNDGRVQLWALDTKQQLWSCWQTSPGGGWTGWSGPNWNGAPLLINIAACQQGGQRGAQLWGITENYTLITDYQVTPGGGWSGWSSESFLGAPQVYEITAAEQNNGCVQLWAITTDQVLMATSQTSPGGNWTAWVS